MKVPQSIPTPVVVGFMAFLLLLFGGYFLGDSHAISSQPVHITDGTGSNNASVNAAGHLSVHIADGGLPSFTGPLGSRHMSFPARPGLSPGECYAAYVRGGGSFESGAVTFQSGGSGEPGVLVRIDSDPVWLLGSLPGATPVSPVTGVSRSGKTWTVGFSYSLSFKAFAGILLCWHGPGKSDGFTVQFTIANGDGNPLRPEEMRFGQQGSTFNWIHLQGPRPQSYELMGTEETLVRKYSSLAPAILYVQKKPRFSYTTKTTVAPLPLRFYVFENQRPPSDPTRVGPFGDWTGE